MKIITVILNWGLIEIDCLTTDVAVITLKHKMFLETVIIAQFFFIGNLFIFIDIGHPLKYQNLHNLRNYVYIYCNYIGCFKISVLINDYVCFSNKNSWKCAVKFGSEPMKVLKITIQALGYHSSSVIIFILLLKILIYTNYIKYWYNKYHRTNFHSDVYFFENK